MKKIAIIGSGIAGLSIAYYLRAYPEFSVDVYFDDKAENIASGVSTGLLSPFSGLYLTTVEDVSVAFNELCYVIKELEQAESKKIFLSKGAYRFSRDKRQDKAFSKREKKSPGDIELMDNKELKDLFPFFSQQWKGARVNRAYCLDSMAYLQSLKSCIEKSQGYSFIQKKLDNLDEVKDYDFIFVAAGAGSLSFIPPAIKEKYKLHLVKGQVLEYQAENLPFSQPLVSSKYLIPNKSNQRLILGATFEKSFTSSSPEQTQALNELKEKGEEVFPKLKELIITKQKSALRLCSGKHKPLWGSLDERVFYLTSLGSKGLLYHALLAKELVSAFVLKQSPKIVLNSPLIEMY
ncbi:MAG: FAD-dependent oxidoreductase [Chlamydiales bacterium]|nr:FAD-binding oxidoreductase [Chlamydiales bacterium]NCF70220.1 FAD-dependent oxidoreductase [Chlamydiales bacterium]